MKICVVGWYFEEEFLRQLHRVEHKYCPYLVCNKPPPFYFDLPYTVKENIGLEFGAYDWYLKNIWDGESNVFFVHDDTELTDITVLDRISEIPHDCSYVFRDWAEERANGGKHGRGIFCSQKFLAYLVEDNGGFWYDKDNHGYVGNGQPRPKRPDGSPVDFNAGITRFHRYLGVVRDRKLGLDVVNRCVFEEFRAGHRGHWRHIDRELKRYGHLIEERKAAK